MRKRVAIVPADAQISPLGTQQSRAMIICPRDGNRKLTIRHGVIGFAAFVVVSAVDIATARAQHWHGKGTWCIQPPIGGGSWECMYYSEAQCRASLGYSSIASCVPNPADEWARREGKQVKKPARRKQDR